MSQVPDRPAVKTAKLCDNCVLLMEGSFNLKKLHNASDVKCDNCGRHAAIASVCEITTKKGAGKV